MQSFNDIENELNKINNNYNKLCEMLEYEEVLQDKKLFLYLNKRMLSLKPIVNRYLKFLQCKNNISDLQNIINTNEQDKQDFVKELNSEIETKNNLEQELLKLFSLQEATKQSILIEIVKNSSELSCKLCEILVEGYSNFLKSNFCDFSISNSNNSVFISVTGDNIKNFFEAEIGTHKIEDDKISNFCYVFVYFDIVNKAFTFNDSELKISACRSSGAGGQHINKTESSIKIVHIPTGIVGISQDERSQFQNKQKALERLKQKVTTFLQQEKQNKIDNQKKQQLNTVKKNVVKIYNLTNKVIVNNKKQQLDMQNFLQGKILN